MKKLIIALLITCFLFLVSCEKKEEEKKNNIEKAPVEVFDINGKIEQNPENNQDNDEINSDEDNNQNNGESSNGETTTDDESVLLFNEEDFKYDIIITKTETNYRKKIAKDNYLELFDYLKDSKYQKFDQCTSCETPIYKITYSENVILIYEYGFFKINDVLFELTSGTFAFLEEYEYTNTESSGWLPWI